MYNYGVALQASMISTTTCHLLWFPSYFNSRRLFFQNIEVFLISIQWYVYPRKKYKRNKQYERLNIFLLQNVKLNLYNDNTQQKLFTYYITTKKKYYDYKKKILNEYKLWYKST